MKANSKRAREAIEQIRYGDKATDKIKLLVITALRIIQKVNTSSRFGKIINKLITSLYKTVTVKIDDLRYSLVDFESYFIILESESYTSLWLKLAEGENLIDIGAHIGKYTLTSAKLIGSRGTVLAIEANPDNFRILKKNIEINNITNAVALNIAAWNKDCWLKLFIGGLEGHHSAKFDWKLGFHKVRGQTMDKIVKDYNFKNIDWIKIDVEGAEWEVLSSMKETINRFRPKIIIELNYENFDQVRMFVEELDYGLVRISPIVNELDRNYAYFAYLPFDT